MMITEKTPFLGVRLATRSFAVNTCLLLVDYETPRVPLGGCATPIFTALINATPAFRQWPGASSWAAEGRGHGRWWFFGWRHFQLMGSWVIWGPGGLDFPGIPENERDWDCYLGVTPMRKSQTTWDPHHPFTHYSWTFLEDSDSHSDGHMTWILVDKRDFRGEGFFDFH